MNAFEKARHKFEGIKGSYVLFGEDICLKHHESDLFLSVKAQTSFHNKLAFDAELTDINNYSERIVFRFQSETSYRDEYERILSTDPIKIFNYEL